jgi:hypothetical protein
MKRSEEDRSGRQSSLFGTVNLEVTKVSRRKGEAMKQGSMIMKGAFVGLFLILAIVMTNNAGFAATWHWDAWDTGSLLGWMKNVTAPSGCPTCDNSVHVEAAGGNPGGYLHIETNFGLGGAMTTKTELSGDYGFAQEITISVDLKFFAAPNLNGAYLRFRYLDPTYNGWRYLLTGSATIGVWRTYRVTINPFWTDAEAQAAGWVKDFNDSTVVSFAQTMSNVYHPEIRLEGGSISAGIDNFTLGKVIFSANFESDTPGSPPNASPPGDPSGDSILIELDCNPTLNPGCADIAVAAPGGGGFDTKSLRISRGPDGSQQPRVLGYPATTWGPYNNGILTIIWRASCQGTQIGANYEPISQWGGSSVLTLQPYFVLYSWHGSDPYYGDILYRDATTEPGGQPLPTGVNWSVDTPQTFRAVVNMATGKFDLFIDESLVAQNRSWQQNFTALQDFYFRIFGGNAAETYHIDDICIIYSVPPPVAGPCAGHGGDSDGDGICDDVDPCPNDPNNDIDKDGICAGIGFKPPMLGDRDNCPFDYNPDQLDTFHSGLGDVCNPDIDGDGVPNVDDNCPLIPNSPPDPDSPPSRTNPQPTCTYEEKVDAPSLPVNPGESIWVEAKFTNNSTLPIRTFPIDSFTTAFELRGSFIQKRDLIPGLYRNPDDVIYIQPGETVSIKVNLCDIFFCEDLPSGPLTGIATFTSVHQPFLEDNPALDDVTATDYFNIQVSSQAAVKTYPATVTFSPDVWKVGVTQTITAYISNVEGHSVEDIDPSTIKLNGSVLIKEGSASISGDVLMVQFDGAAAIGSLGTLTGATFYPTVEGKLNKINTTTDRFLAKGEIKMEPILIVKFDKYTVGFGAKPVCTKEPIEDGVQLRLYSKARGSCAAGYGISWCHYPEIWNGKPQFAPCPYAASALTVNGKAVFYDVPSGDYLVIGEYKYKDSKGGPQTVYIGSCVGSLPKATVVTEHLYIIQSAAGRVFPCLSQIISGSELQMIQPEYVEWSGTQEVYPFVFESTGDWTVTTSVQPPQGFVANNKSLTTDVNDSLKAVQFTVTDVGSKWKPTKVKHKIKHKGKTKDIEKEIGIKLTPELAKKKGVGIYGE